MTSTSKRATAGAMWLVLALCAPASAEPLACKRAIARATVALGAATMQALAKCERAKTSGALGPDVVCATDQAQVAAITTSEQKLRAEIAKACGGTNHACASTDTGGDADDSLGDIGWDVGTCPDLENAGCTNAIQDCDGIATCVACIATTSATHADDLYAGAFEAATPGTSLARCQSAIVKEGARFFVAEGKALGKCEDAVLRGAASGPCPSGDPATVNAIAKAETAKEKRICLACGGADHACGGSDDLGPGDIGFAAACPDATVPGGAACAHPVTALGDVVSCVDCMSDFETACLDAAAVPAVKPYPPACHALPTPTVTPTPTATPTPPAGADAIRCERAIVKNAGSFLQTKQKALGGCEEAKLVGKLPPSTDCPTEPKTAAKIAKAAQKLAAGVPKACGGANRSCDVLDGGRDADLLLGEIGWDVGACPNLENGACNGPLADCDDVGDCLSCVAEAAVDRVTALAYGFTPADPSTPAGVCQRAIGRGATTLLAARTLALEKCEDAVIRGRVPGPCPDPGDGKAAAAIAKANARFMQTVCKACGGSDGDCGGGDDLTPSALGFAATCPDVVVPAGPACGGAIQSLADLVDCAACVAAFDSSCVDRTFIPRLRGVPPECNPGAGGTPTPTPSPTPGGTAVCGNGVVEPGEDCDDGNTVNCDGCPSDCHTSTAPVACPTAGRFAQQLHLVAPSDQVFTGGVFCIDYPAHIVAFPGTGGVPSRVTGIPGGLPILNDFDNAVQLSFVSNPPRNDFTPTISFDLCAGASAPPPTDFNCVTKQADNQGTPIDPPSLIVCTPVGP